MTFPIYIRNTYHSIVWNFLKYICRFLPLAPLSTCRCSLFYSCIGGYFRRHESELERDQELSCNHLVKEEASLDSSQEGSASPPRIWIDTRLRGSLAACLNYPSPFVIFTRPVSCAPQTNYVAESLRILIRNSLLTLRCITWHF